MKKIPTLQVTKYTRQYNPASNACEKEKWCTAFGNIPTILFDTEVTFLNEIERKK